MTRHRARPSFTVEIKRNRNASLSLHEDPGRERAAQALWHGTPLAEAPHRPHVLETAFARAETSTKPPASKPAPSTPARRVLPSLIQPIAADPEPTPPSPIESPAPKARATRPAVAVKPRRKAVPAPAPRRVEMAAPIIAPPPLQVQTAPPIAQERSAEERGRRYTRRKPPELKAGERWKRRLPRACW